jgi:hypothetical protein
MEEDSIIVAQQQMRALAIINLSVKRWSYPSHLSFWQSPWSLDYIERSLWVYRNNNVIHVQEQTDHARWNNLIVYCKRSFGLDCKSRRWYQGVKMWYWWYWMFY